VRRIERGIRATAGPETIRLTADVDLRGENFRTCADFTVRAGERIPFTLTWYPSHVRAPARREALRSLRETEAWWREWSERCRYEGEWRDTVLRSLITLKALTYAPTGGICAAATTSLPEQLGGVRNWDYRYCWLRDAAFALHALMIGGYVDEARAWREWLLRAVAGKPSETQTLYGLAGERRLTEYELPWLPGYEGARPVRIGNAAFVQRQLDICGEVAGMLDFAARVGLEPNENAWRMQAAMLRFLESDWQRPDEGIWEVRGVPRNFTHSKVMAWVAVDRAVTAVRNGRAGPLDRWAALASKIREEVLREGFDTELGSFVQYYGAKDVDASSLLFSLVGFLPATDPRMVGTVRAIQERLLVDGLVARYRTAQWIDGLPPGEGLFITCTFWLADNLALQGRVGEARELVRALAQPAQRRRAAERAMGSELPASDRKLPAGLFSRGIDQHGVESREGSVSGARFGSPCGARGRLAYAIERALVSKGAGSAEGCSLCAWRRALPESHQTRTTSAPLSV
jgi:GH15 family glucan-1,4-alpha-glucosidase